MQMTHMYIIHRSSSRSGTHVWNIYFIRTPITAKHDVNSCEVSTFIYKSCTSCRTPGSFHSVRYKLVRYLPHTAAIPAKHDVNKCEESRFYRSSRSYRNPADHSDPTNRTERIPVRIYRSYRSQRFHSGRSYRSNPVKMCRPHRSHSGTHLWNIYLIQTPSRLNMLQTSVKYPHFTDPSHHTGIRRSYKSCRSYEVQILQVIHMLQIMQIPQVMQIHWSKCAYHADHTYLIPMYRCYRSHKFHSGRLYRYCRSYRSSDKTWADHADRTGPISLKMYRSGS